MEELSLEQRIVRETVVVSAPLVPELQLHLVTHDCRLWHATEADAAAAGLPVERVAALKKVYSTASSMEAPAPGSGGEAGPVHSAGLKIADKLDWPLADLRIDWSARPIDDLAAAWAVFRPQMAAYVQRAIDPTQAPSYGVPGDE